MKIKCGIIYNAVDIISQLSEKPMKVSLACKILRLADDLQKENNYIDKQRREIIEKYASKDENGNLIIENDNIRIENEALEEAQKELAELSSFEVDIPDRMITEEDFENSDLQLTINQLSTLREFFHKEESEVVSGGIIE